MKHRLWSRELPAISAPAAAGIVYTAAWLTALVVWTSNLSVAASGAEVVAGFAGHEGVAIAQYLLAQGVAAAALATVAIALGRSVGAGRLGRVAMVAGVGAAVVSLVQLALGLLLAGWAVADGETGRAHFLFAAINRLDGVKMFALAAMAAAGGGLELARRAGGRRVLPRWLSAVAAVLALALVASGVGYLLLNATLAAAAYVSLAAAADLGHRGRAGARPSGPRHRRPGPA